MFEFFILAAQFLHTEIEVIEQHEQVNGNDDCYEYDVECSEYPLFRCGEIAIDVEHERDIQHGT